MESGVHHATWATFPSRSPQKQDALLLCPVPGVQAGAVPGATPPNPKLLRGQETQASLVQT